MSDIDLNIIDDGDINLILYDDGTVNVSVVDTGDLNVTFDGISSFQTLSDTPISYTGKSGKTVTVNSTEDGVEFSSAGSGNVSTSGTPVDNDFAKFTDASTIEGRSYSEVRTDLNIEDGADVTDATNVASAGAAMSGGAFHDGFSDFVADEHLNWKNSVGTIHAGNYTNTTYAANQVLDWTADQGATNINAGNYTNTGDTTAHASFSQLDYASAGHTGFAPALTGDQNYVTDDDITLLGNTTNTNSGDQDISGIGTNTTAIGFNTTHRGLTNNPHSVDKTDVGLSNVPNVDTTNASNISSGTLSSAIIPPVALTTVQVAVSQVAQLALTTEEGDVVVRSDENKSYMRNDGTAEDMTDFTELQTPTDTVLSVNSETGTVVLTTGDIGVDADSNYVTDAQVTLLGQTTNTNSGDNAVNSNYSGLVSNVTTNLSEGTNTETTVKVASSDGTDATMVSASTSRAGLLTKAKWDEIVANSLKATNIAHPLVEEAVPSGAVFTDTTYTSSDFTHNSLNGLNDGTDYEHLTATQVAALHAESHDIASHNDTTATGTELNTLTDNSVADTLHRHSELVASDGSLDPAVSVDASGNIGIGTTSPDYKLEVIGSFRADSFKTDETTSHTVFVGDDAGGTGTFTTFVGEHAGQENTGAYSNAVGSYALQHNTGAYSNAVGSYALQHNTGANSNAVGYYALRDNTGTYSNAIGSNALRDNTGAYSNALGGFALYHNTGDYSTAVGYYALFFNTGAGSNAIGYRALRYNDGTYNTAFGHNAFNTWTADSGSAMAVAEADVIPATNSVTVVGHGYATAINLVASTSGVLPTGLSTGIHQWQVTDVDTLQCKTDSFSDNGTGVLTLTPSVSYSNSGAFGYDAEPDASNQIVLGNSAVTQVKTAGSVYAGGSGDSYFGGDVGIGTTTPGEKLDVVGNAEINGNIIVTGTVDGIDIATDVAANTAKVGVTSNTPASAAATGTTGTMCWDADYIYVCTATNTWKRVAIGTWS